MPKWKITPQPDKEVSKSVLVGFLGIHNISIGTTMILFNGILEKGNNSQASLFELKTEQHLKRVLLFLFLDDIPHILSS